MTRMNKLTALAAVVALSLGLAACGGGGGGTAMMGGDGTDMPDPAATEAAAITNAIEAARMAVESLTGDSSDMDVAAANAAITAAHNAIQGAEHASSADTVANVAALDAVRASLTMAQNDIDAHRANVEAMALAAAKMKADEAAMAARMKATEARTAANRVAEILGADSDSAMAADAAADAAEAAADMAEAASMRAQEDTMSSDAEDEQQTAEAEQGKAEMQYAVAEELRREAQQFADNNEQRDLADARDDAKMYADMATEHYEAAVSKAADARAEARDARAAANKAMAARTDYDNADKYADMAEAAADAADEAVATALAAKNAAQAAHMAAMDATTAEAAQAEANKARAQNVIATAQHTGDNGAGMNYMAAKDAAMKAEMAAEVHVLGLLLAANAADVEDVATTPNVDENAAAIMPFATAIGTAAAAVGNGSGGTTATTTYPGVPDNPDTADTDESEGNVLTITVAPEGGTALMFRTEAMEDDPDTDGVDESAPKTATMIGGLDDFMHGYSITDGTTHAIVFTNRMQDEPPVEAVTAVTEGNLVNDPVSGNTVADLGTKSGTGYTGVTYYEGSVTINDDTDTGLAYTGTLTCPSGTECSASVAADGAVTIAGYVFTGSREARADVTAMDAAAQAAARANYLAFGVWLQEDGDGSGTPQFGAFSAGGSGVTGDTYGGAVVTGSATYEGDAAGVYTQGSSVDYFQGDATLNAEFGDEPETGDDTVLGTITGMIDNIMAGGMATGDVIYLNDDATPDDGNITATGAIAGDARMGTVTMVDAVTTYSHNGSWSGQFYNGTADDTDTADVNESHMVPGSVAGTFGVTGTVGEGDAAVTTSYVGAFAADE